jgi:hypothetical protein
VDLSSADLSGNNSGFCNLQTCIPRKFEDLLHQNEPMILRNAISGQKQVCAPIFVILYKMTSPAVPQNIEDFYKVFKNCTYSYGNGEGRAAPKCNQWQITEKRIDL